MTLPLLAGAAAFPVLLLSDYGKSRSIPVLTVASTVISAALLGYAFVASILDPWKALLPIPLRAVLGVLGAAFLFLLIRSVFLEIPKEKRDGRAATDRRLVTTGTYALVRHPGVIWFLFFLLGAAAASDSMALLVAAPLWTGIDLAYVAVQDRLFLPRLFGNAYRDYSRITPFIIPSARSIRLCYETWHVPFCSSTTKNGGHHGNAE